MFDSGACLQRECLEDRHCLCALQASASSIPVLLLVDTTGCDCEEEVEEEGESKRNHGEATIVLRHAQQLVDAGLLPEQIGVITPYNGQVAQNVADGCQGILYLIPPPHISSFAIMFLSFDGRAVLWYPGSIA